MPSKFLYIYVSLFNLKQIQFLDMINRNCADYTNFDGKTNKKIVQAPGGLSSFSLAWSNEPTDYGNDRNIYPPKKQAMSYHQQPSHPKNAHQYNDYSEPIRVMDPYPGYQHAQENSRKSEYLPQDQRNFESGQSPNLGGNYGGEQGYRNLGKQPPMNQGYGGYGQQIDQIDIAMQEHQQRRPPSVPRKSENPLQGKPSIKINGPPRQNFIIGNDYNYWKEGGKQDVKPPRKQYSREYPREQNEQPVFGQRPPPQQYTTQKTSIRMYHPPGGKQNFSLG